MREKNIFYNIIKNETSLTEAFCNFLNFKPFRELFLNIVSEKNEKINNYNILYKHFETEKYLSEENGRSDLHLKINDEKYIFEVKIEKYTKLTDNQPNGYLNYLEMKNENLFFIIPKNYLHIDEICSRWNCKTKYDDNKILSHNIIYWEDIISQIKKSELHSLNVFINEFCKIIEYRWLKYENIKFLPFEIEAIFNDKKNTNKDMRMLLNTNIPVIIRKLFEIIDKTYDKFEIDNKVDEQTSNFYGYKLRNNQYSIPTSLEVWFGVDYEIWERNNYPITIQILSSSKENNALEKIKELDIATEFTDSDNSKIYYIGLEKDVFLDEDSNIIEKLENLIRQDVIDKIKLSNI